MERPTLLVAVVALVASGCDRPGAELASDWIASVPANADRGERCLDVGDRRACWDPACERGICAVERTLPGRALPEGGWRCWGAGQTRRCQPRRRGSSGFACRADGACTQRRPRLPDDGEWECTDRSGAVVCRGGIAAAGVVAGADDPGWLCGSGAPSFWGDRVCVDLSPDVPQEAGGWSCRFEGDADATRLCVPSSAPRLAGPCDTPGACPDGSACIAGICLPPKPAPSCFLDSDCASGKCLFGSCA
jgi:hypothetical protein